MTSTDPNTRRENRPVHPWGKPKRFRRLRWLLFGIAVFVLLVAAAPTFVSKTPLVNRALSSALESGQGEITAGGASLGWFSDLTLKDVRVNGPDGKILFTAESVELDRSLLRLASNATDLGTVRVAHPTLHLRTRPDGSNLEDFLEPWLGPSDREPLTIDVEINDGTIEAADEPTGETWKADGIEATYTVKPRDSEPPAISLSVSAVVHPATGAAGKFELTFHPNTGGGQRLDISTESFPIGVIAPLVRRVQADAIQLAGRLTTKSTTTWTASDQATATPIGSIVVAESSGHATITELDAAAAILGGDRLNLSRLHVPWDVRFDEEQIRIRTLEIRSDIGWFSAQGSAAVTAWFDNDSGANAVSPLAAALREPLVARGKVDLALLAAQLPRTLRIRQGTTISSGEASFELNSAKVDGGHRWSGEIETANLAAETGGKQWRWDQPVRMTFAVREAAGWTIEALRCDSDFLEVTASGNLGRMAFQANCDLDKLTARLGQFVDLAGWQLTGRGVATANIQSTANQYQLDAHAELTSFRIASGATIVVDEPNLTADARVSGETVSGAPSTCREAFVQLISGNDSLDLRLREPISFSPSPTMASGGRKSAETRAADTTAPRLLNANSVGTTNGSSRGVRTAATNRWAFDLTASGRLSRWLTRFKHWVPLDDWEIDGNGTVTAQIAAQPSEIRVAEAAIKVDQLHALGPGWQIDDPRVELTVKNVSFAAEGRRLVVGESILTSSAIATRSRDVLFEFPTGAIPRASGHIAFRAMLDRLHGWKTPGHGPPNYWRYSGEATGTLQVDRQDGVTNVDLDTVVTDATLYEFVSAESGTQPGYRTAWQEPNVRLTGKISHDVAADRLRIESAHISSDSLSVNAAGMIDRISSDRMVNVQGTADYDLAKWSPYLASYVGGGVRLTGRDQATFQIAGPVGSTKKPALTLASATSRQPPTGNRHWSRNLRGAFSAGWESIDLYGLPVAAGRISARFAEGSIEVDPLQVAVGEGRLSAAARLRLDPSPQELFPPHGEVISKVRITPEVSSRLLKFIAPVVADATATDGRFSLTLAGGRIPLANPKTIDISGQLSVHSVRIMPGPLAREWLLIAEQIEALLKSRQPPQQLSRPKQTWLAINDRQVDFRVADGRVHHQGLEFSVGEVLVRSHGSVGFDESLALELEIPIDRKWADASPWLRGIQGQTLRVAVRGTFSRPEIDRRALQGMTRQVLRGAAQGVIEDQLRRLLRPK